MNINEFIIKCELDKQFPIDKDSITDFINNKQQSQYDWVKDIFKESTNTTTTTEADATAVDQINSYYNLTVPKLGENGSCSLKTEFEQFDLTSVLGERTSETDLKLVKLYKVIDTLQKITNVDWLGIYKTSTYKNSDNIDEKCLLKLAYYGEHSRPVFPLTEYFQTISNNSWVGLNGKLKLIQSLDTYEGVYYNCSDKVKSEICVPIYDKDQNVIGIIDAESWKDNHFTKDIILIIIQLAISLSSYL